MKKRIVFLSAFLSPYRSGAEAMVEEVAKRLSDRYDITIVTGRYSRSLPKHDTLGGNVRVIRIGLGFGFDKWLYPFLAPIQLGKLRPQIVHAVLETFAGLALLFSRGRAKKILTLQTTNRSFLKSVILRFPDRVTAISKVLVHTAASFGRSDVVLIPNGVDLSAVREACGFHAKDSGRVLFVGRLEPMKGVDTLLRAFALAIKGLDPSIHLRIVGDGSEATKLRALAEHLEIDHRVMFTGRIAGKAVFDEYARAEIFCGLSRSEALGNVFLEAQAAGCTVLATRTGGIPDIVCDSESGMLVAPDDVGAAAESLRTLLTDPALRAKLSGGGRRNAEQYDWNAVAQQYDDLYTST